MGPVNGDVTYRYICRFRSGPIAQTVGRSELVMFAIVYGHSVSEHAVFQNVIFQVFGRTEDFLLTNKRAPELLSGVFVPDFNLDTGVIEVCRVGHTQFCIAPKDTCPILENRIV